MRSIFFRLMNKINCIAGTAVAHGVGLGHTQGTRAKVRGFYQ
jgi:hypothetical protein